MRLYLTIKRGRGEDYQKPPEWFHPGQMEVWNARETTLLMLCGSQSGKPLDANTTIPTTNGLVRIADLKPGDFVFGDDGLPVEVVYATGAIPPRGGCYEFTFDDKTTVVSDGEHLWEACPMGKRKHGYPPTIYSTEEIANTWRPSESARAHRRSSSYSIDLAPPIELPDKELPIGPYTLGAWLGDGTSRAPHITNADAEVTDEIVKEGYEVAPCKSQTSGKATTYKIYAPHRCVSTWDGHEYDKNAFRVALTNLGLICNKHIPEEYFTASYNQRLALLQGYMDTDGSCSSLGKCEFTSKSERLAKDVVRLCATLGIKAIIYPKTAKCNGKDCGIVYRCGLSTTLPVFRIKRKLERIPKSIRIRASRRYIVNVRKVEDRPVACIKVANHSHLFLCTEAYIPTHNTVSAPELMLREIQACGPGDYAIGGPTFPLMSTKLVPLFRQVFEVREKLGKMKGGGSQPPEFHFSKEGLKKIFGSLDIDELAENHGKDYVADFFTGRPLSCTIFFKHATDSNAWESSTFKAIVADEAGMSTYTLAVYEAMQRRVSVARGHKQSKLFGRENISQGRIIFPTTPYQLGWLKTEVHDRCIDLKDKDGNIKRKRDKNYRLVSFESTMNPVFPKAYFEEQRKLLPAWKFEMMYRGRFTRPAGVIYDCFDTDAHIVDDFPIPEDWPRYLGSDYGVENTGAVMLAREMGSDSRGRPVPADQYYLYAEYGPEGGKSIEGHVASIKKIGQFPKLPESVGGQPDEDGWRRAFSMAGLPTHSPRIRNVELGIQTVYGAIKSGKLKVFRSCEGVISEFLFYSRELDTENKPTVKIADKSKFHLMDALRYIGGWIWRDFTPSAEGKPKARARSQGGIWKVGI